MTGPRRKRPPRSRVVWVRRSVALLVALLVVVAVGLFVRSQLDDWAREILEARLGQMLDGQARIGRFHVSPWRLEAEFAEVELTLDAAPGDPLRLTLPEGRARLAWSGLAALGARRVRLAELHLSAPRLTFDRDFLRTRAASGRSGRPFDLRIDKLDLIEGRLRYDEQETEFEVHAERIELHGGWDAARRALAGELAFGVRLLRPPLAEPLPLEVTGEFLWRPRDVELRHVRARGPGIELEGAATLGLLEGLTLVGRGRLRADVAPLGALLDPGFPAISGSVAGPFGVSLGPGPLQVRGELTAEEPRFGRISAKAATATLHLAPGGLTLAELDARAFGGAVGGKVRVDWEGPTTFDARLDGRDLGSRALLAWIGVDLPLEARIGAELTLGGLADEPGRWNGSGSFSARPGDLLAGGWPTAGEGLLAIDDGRWRLEASPLEVAAARFTVELETSPAGGQDGRLTLRGSTIDARQTQLGTLAILDALDVAVPALLETPISGSGPVEARIDLGGRGGVTTGLELRDGAWGRQPFDRATARVEMLGDRVEIRELELARGPATLRATGRLDPEPLTIDALDLECRQLDAGWLVELLGGPGDVAGRVDADVRVAGPAGLARGRGRLEIGDLGWQGELLSRVVADVEIEPSAIHFPSIEVEGAAVAGHGSASWFVESSSAEVTLEGVAVRVEQLDAVRRRELPIAGDLVLDGSVRFDPDGVAGTVQIAGRRWSVQGRDLGASTGRVRLDSRGADVELAADGGWAVDGRLDYLDGMPFAGRVTLDGVTVEPGGDAPGIEALTVTGAADVGGSLGRPETLSVAGEIERLSAQVGDRSIVGDGQIGVEFEDGVLRLEPVHLMGGGTRVDGRLTYDVGRDDLDLSAAGTVDLALVSAALPEVRASGPVALELRLRGPRAAPDWSGTVRGTGGRLRWLGIPQGLEQIEFEARLERNRAYVDRLQARFGNGQITVEGEQELVGLGLGAYRASIRADNVRLAYPSGFRGIYEADLELRGEPGGARIDGEVRLLRGLYDRPFGLAQLLGSGAREYSAAITETLPDTVALDVDLIAEDNLWLRNEQAEIEASAALHLGGTALSPELTGRMWLLEGGRIEFRGTRYRLDSASLDFVELDRLNPYLTLRAQTDVREYRVFLVVEGTLDSFDYELTSDPVLSPQDIIALLTTGNTLNELTASGRSSASATGDLAANYFAGALTTPFNNQLERLLGIERVEINPLLIEGEADPTTRVTLGKEITDEVTVVFSTDLGNQERQLYEIEWQTSPKFQLTAQRDTLGGIGGDVRYATRFWWNAPSTQPQPAESGRSRPSVPATDGPLVTRLRLEGVAADGQADLRRRIVLREGEPFSRSAMFRGVEELRRYYVSRGRIEARIDARDQALPGGVEVTYHVDPGLPTEVVLDGAPRKEERRLRQLLEQTWIDEVFHEDLYDDSARRIRDFYHERGHYAVDVRHRAELRDGRRAIRFEIDRGKPVRVARVDLEGAQEISPEVVRRQVLTRPAAAVSRRYVVPSVLEADIEAIRNLYREEGFLDASVGRPRIRLSTAGDSAEITIAIDEGARSTIGRIDVLADGPFSSDEVRDWSELAAGDVYSRGRLLQAQSRIRSELDRRGHPGAQVRGRGEREGQVVAVRFEIDSGPRSHVAEVRIAGNDLTREKIIRRELELAPGDLISREKLLRSQHALYRLRIFRNVRLTLEPVDPDDPAGQRLLVDVEELAPWTGGVGAGWDSEAGTRASFSLGHDNLGGYDRYLGIQGRVSGLQRRVQVTAEEPRLFTRRLPTLLNLSWEDREETGFTAEIRGAAVRVDRRFNPRWRGWTRYSFQRVDISDVEDPQELQEEKLEDVRLGDVGLSIIRNTREPFLATRGSTFAAELRLFAKGLASERNFVKTSLYGAYVRPLGAGFQFASGARLGLAFPFGSTETIPISESFFAGGDSTLRGFDRDEVGAPDGGEAQLLLNQELRFPIWQALKGVVFYDAGNVWADAADLEPDDLRHVLGTGLRFETPIGAIRLEYGRKVDREDGESTGEVFLAIGSAF